MLAVCYASSCLPTPQHATRNRSLSPLHHPWPLSLPPLQGVDDPYNLALIESGAGGAAGEDIYQLPEHLKVCVCVCVVGWGEIIITLYS